MNNQKHLLVLFLFLMVSVTSLRAQVAASPSAGCAPLSVVLSGVAGGTSEFWTLGAGMGTSLLSSPNVLYTTPGTFNITYTAMVAGNPVSYSTQVVVKPVPTANFSYAIPSSHCKPMAVSFVATGSSTNAIYTWAFGDLGALGYGATITHTYTFANSFIPVMTVLDVATSCTALATVVSGGTIHVSDPPVINITANNGYSGCVPPFVTSFNASGSTSGSPISGGALSFYWTISGGSPSSSSSANIGPVTFGAGTSTVGILVSDNNQCSNVTTSIVTVVNPSLTVTVPGTVCIKSPVPATVQTSQGSVFFNVTGSVNPIYFLTTPTVDRAIDTVCFFTLPGPTTMTVGVQTAPNCPVISVLKQIFVEEIVVNFTCTPPSSTCQPTLVATYLNLTTINNSSSLSFLWQADFVPNASHFATPSTTTMNNTGPATFTFAQGSVNPYTIYPFFIPAITLNAVSNSIAHCNASKVITIFDTIGRPSANFYTNVKQGCAPLTVSFTSYSYVFPTYPVLTYTWCNGASPPTFSIGTVPLPPATNSAIPAANFTYTNPGVYYPYLMLSTTGGCYDISFIDTITVVNPPTNLAASYPTQVCAGQPFTFTLSGTGTSAPPVSVGIDHWHVATDDNYFSGCITNSTPTWSFANVGVKNVTLTAYQAGCKSSLALTQAVTVMGPIGKFRYETNCTNKTVVSFSLELHEVNTAVLDFGDNTTPASVTGNISGSAMVIITHTYLNTGNFTASLTSTNGSNGCAPFGFFQQVKLRNGKARITYNNLPLPIYPAPLACTKSPIKFSGGNSSDVSGCGRGYTWFFQAPPNTSPPMPGFTMTPLDYGSFLYQTIFLYPSPPPTTLALYVVPTLLDTFRYAGTYTIGLMVKDENGCMDLETKLFRISSAKPAFTLSPNPVCLSAGTVQLINGTQAIQVAPDVIKKYKWIFGDGTPTDSTTTPFTQLTHTLNYATVPYTIFSASLIATNQLGCVDTTVHSWQVNRPYPYLSLSTTHPCIPKNLASNVNFYASLGYATYSVNYGDTPTWSTFSNTFTNVFHPYSVPGVYTPTLTIYDAAGCSETQTLLITATGQPTASLFFEDGKDKFCIPGEPHIKSNSSINSSSITGYAWTYATPTNTIASPATSINSFTNIIPAPGIYTISLTVDVNGFCPSTTSVLVGVYNPTATAMVTPTMFCLGQTINASINIIDGVDKWKWFFGDNVPQPINFNTVFSHTTVSYPYTIYPTNTSTGATTLTLLYDAPSDGCSRTVTVALQVIKLDAAFKQLRDMYTHCLGIRDTFISTGPNPLNLNLNYSWKYGDDAIGFGLQSNHAYTLAGVYPVEITATATDFACVAKAVKTITVFPLPKANLVITPTLSCPNATFEINGSGLPGVSGILTGTLTPMMGTTAINFAPSNTFVMVASASVTTTYTLKVRDNNGCESSPVFDKINIQEPAKGVSWDTTIIIGQPTPLNAYVGSTFTYTWSPLITNLDCSTCFSANAISNTTANITYTVLVEDELRCSIVKNTYSIFVKAVVKLDVPSAFTPNGDGINDVIFPGGWGLRKLNYFKVFNRWGQLIFESNDLKVGWDGLFQGVPQNLETYVYQVSVETYSDTEPVLTKTGTFKLIR